MYIFHTLIEEFHSCWVTARIAKLKNTVKSIYYKLPILAQFLEEYQEGEKEAFFEEL
jgi:hypothetical protein